MKIAYRSHRLRPINTLINQLYRCETLSALALLMEFHKFQLE